MAPMSGHMTADLTDQCVLCQQKDQAELAMAVSVFAFHGRPYQTDLKTTVFFFTLERATV